MMLLCHTALFCLLALNFRLSLAQSKVYSVNEFVLDLKVDQYCYAEAREEITFFFQEGEFSKAYRSILLDGFKVHDFEVRSPDTTVSDVKKSVEGDIFSGQWSFPVVSGPANITFVLEYTTTKVVKQFDTDRFNLKWITTGENWDVSIATVEATFHLPSYITSQDYNEIDTAPPGSILDGVIRWKWTYPPGE